MPDATIPTVPFPSRTRRHTQQAQPVATPEWAQTARSPLHATLDDSGHALSGPATVVWPATQHTDSAQRAGRYHPHTPGHPARLRPAIAAHLIHQYSQPEQTVLDLFCGAGTAAVEAIHAGRHTIAIDNDPHWLEATGHHLAYATAHGATGHATVLHADTRTLPAPRRWRGTVELVIATPPIRLTPSLRRQDRGNATLTTNSRSTWTPPCSAACRCYIPAARSPSSPAWPAATANSSTQPGPPNTPHNDTASTSSNAPPPCAYHYATATRGHPAPR
jgi:hypothetical protein